MLFFKKIATRFMPHVCMLCKNLTHQSYDLCPPCEKHLPILTHACKTCGTLLPETVEIGPCSICLQTKPPFDTTHALFLYEPPVPKLILDLKFHHALTNAKLFSDLFIQKILSEWYQKNDLPTALIPIPLHVKRLQTRGFNQAVEIARPVAKALGIPLFLKNISRIKPTLPQATLSAAARKQNIKDAFIIRESFKNRHVAVLDDVITTGNTVFEFCHELKKQGAAKISVWCVARRVSYFSDNK